MPLFGRKQPAVPDGPPDEAFPFFTTAQAAHFRDLARQGFAEAGPRGDDASRPRGRRRRADVRAGQPGGGLPQRRPRRARVAHDHPRPRGPDRALHGPAVAVRDHEPPGAAGVDVPPAHPHRRSRAGPRVVRPRGGRRDLRGAQRRPPGDGDDLPRRARRRSSARSRTCGARAWPTCARCGSTSGSGSRPRAAAPSRCCWASRCSRRPSSWSSTRCWPSSASSTARRTACWSWRRSGTSSPSTRSSTPRSCRRSRASCSSPSSATTTRRVRSHPTSTGGAAASSGSSASAGPTARDPRRRRLHRGAGARQRTSVSSWVARVSTT